MRNENRMIGTSGISTLAHLARRLRYGRKYRDSFFCGLFGNDKRALLELYNALNDSEIEDPDEVEVVTIENAIYITNKNDVAYILNGTINLYEHQSTHNPNMPVRFLVYLAQEYQKYLENRPKAVYKGDIVTLPTPKCVVFYNGEVEDEEQYKLKLSDAFANKQIKGDAELTVHVYNVNAGHNQELMSKCKTLYGYSILVDKVTRYKKNMPIKAAIERAIEECIEEDILKTYLRKHRSEVLGSLLTDFDMKAYKEAVYEDGYDTGYDTGYGAGAKNEHEKSIDNLAKYIQSNNPEISWNDAVSKAESILSVEAK